MHWPAIRLAPVLLSLFATSLQAENRSIDGSGNNLSLHSLGAANTPFIRFGYGAQFFGPDSAMPSDLHRANARTISNAVSAQSASRPSARNLSNYIWAWGQFLTHDTDLSTTSNGPAVNGVAPIAVNTPGDPLGPNPIPFTRANFVATPISIAAAIGIRTPVNEVTSYIDASNVYGSDTVRAAALRTNGGTGAKLLTSAGNLLPRNMAGLPIENNGPLPDEQLFLAGDVRANENSLLTSLHTIFTREHNRLVDRIAARQPSLNNEQQYQLARKLVGAEMQVITYREFLPALLGNGSSVPKAEHYSYSSLSPEITTAFSHAAFRFGHSAVTSQLNLVDSNNAPAGSLALREVFFNPEVIGSDPDMIDKLLRGAARQVSEEIDTLVVDDLRNFLFGPPGAGGLDLASLNIQRARDAGLPPLGSLIQAYDADSVPNFSSLTFDSELALELSSLYIGQVGNMDAWVAGLAQDHAPGASVGDFFQRIIEGQFLRLRDGDRLFYRGNATGLYTNGVLNPDIAAVVDLDNLTLADVILANTSVGHLQSNVFFVPNVGDYNGDGTVDAADYIVWRKTGGTQAAYDTWRANFGRMAGSGSGAARSVTAAVPEPATCLLLLVIVGGMFLGRRRKLLVSKLGRA